MKILISALMLTLYLGPLAASSNPIPDRSYQLSSSQGMRGSNRQSGPYRYAISARSNWIGWTRDFALGANFSAGLGLHLGGPEFEMRTTDAWVSSGAARLDLNNRLSARARIRFHDFVPYAQLSYHNANHEEGFAFRIDAGVRLLSHAETSLELGGPLASEIQYRDELLRELEREARDEIDKIYLEPVLRVNLKYRFG